MKCSTDGGGKRMEAHDNGEQEMGGGSRGAASARNRTMVESDDTHHRRRTIAAGMLGVEEAVVEKESVGFSERGSTSGFNGGGGGQAAPGFHVWCGHAGQPAVTSMVILANKRARRQWRSEG